MLQFRIYSPFLRLFLALSLVGFSLKGFGQNNVTEQVEVKRQFKPVLGESLKIRKSPYFPDEPSKPLLTPFGFKDISLKKDTASNSIMADSLHQKDSARVFPFFLQAGAGSLNTLLGELYFSSLPSPKGNFTANYRHYGFSGKLKNQKFSRDQINFDGKKVIDGNYLSAHFGVEVQSNPFYGYDHNLFSFSSTSVKQDFKNINARLEFGKIADTSEGIHYFAKLGGYSLSDSYAEKESHLDFFGGLGFSRRNFGFNLKADYQKNIFTTQPAVFNTTLGRLKPSLLYIQDLLQVQLGLNIVYELGDRNQTYIFPDIKLDVELAEGFTVYGGVKGDILQNSFKGFTRLNPYLRAATDGSVNQNFNLQNTKESILIYAGIKGNLSASTSYRVQVDISQSDRMAFFANTLSTPDNFTLVYDGNKTLLTQFYGEINYLASDQFRFNAELTILNYKLSSIAKPYYTPNFKLEASGHYNPIPNWYLSGTLSWLGTQFSSVRLSPDSPLTTIKPFLDINLDIEYRVSKKVGVFIQGNNLLNKEYLQFYNYPVLGINVLAGINLRF